MAWNDNYCDIDAVCRDCGKTYKKRVWVSQKDFDKSSDTMKHFIKRGECSKCRLERNFNKRSGGWRYAKEDT